MIAVSSDHPRPLDFAPGIRGSLLNAGKETYTNVEPVATGAISQVTLAAKTAYPLWSMVLMMKPRVGLVS